MQQHFTHFLVQTEVACYAGLFISNTNGKNNKMKLLYHGQIFQEPSSYIIFTARNSSCGKVMFSQACVIPSVHKKGGISQHATRQGGCVSQHAIGKGVFSQGVSTAPSPPRDGHWCRQYASYWNTFLFCLKLVLIFGVGRSDICCIFAGHLTRRSRSTMLHCQIILPIKTYIRVFLYWVRLAELAELDEFN